MDIPHFAYLLTAWWTIEVFPLFHYHEACCSEHCCCLGFCVRFILLQLLEELDMELEDQAVEVR